MLPVRSTRCAFDQSTVFSRMNDLLQRVNRVFKRFCELIRNNPVLWIYVNITLHCYLVFKIFYYFWLSLCQLGMYCRLHRYSFYTQSQFVSIPKNLPCLNLIACDLSTICFVQYLPQLEQLDVTQCDNLQNCDFSCHFQMLNSRAPIPLF